MIVNVPTLHCPPLTEEVSLPYNNGKPYLNLLIGSIFMHVRQYFECLTVCFQKKWRFFTYLAWEGWLCFPVCVAIIVRSVYLFICFVFLGSSFYGPFNKRVDFFIAFLACIHCGCGCLRCLNTCLSYRKTEGKQKKSLDCTPRTHCHRLLLSIL